MNHDAADIVLYYSKRRACAGSAQILELIRANAAHGCSLVCVEDLMDVLRERGETLPEWLDGTPICVEIVSDRERIAYRGTDAVRLIHTDNASHEEAVDRVDTSRSADRDTAYDAHDATLNLSHQGTAYDAPPRPDSLTPGDTGDEGEGPHHDAEVDFQSRAARGKLAPGMQTPRSSETPASYHAAVDESAARAEDVDLDDRWTFEGVDEDSDSDETEVADGKVTDDMLASALRDRNISSA